VLGEYSAETVQTVAACMTVEQIAELQLAFPTFTEGVSMAAQKICRSLGIGRFPRSGAISAPKTDGLRAIREQQRPTKASVHFLYLTKTYPIHPFRGTGPYPAGHAPAAVVIRTRVTVRAPLRSRSRPWRS
jgi:hypothetical protein